MYCQLGQVIAFTALVLIIVASVHGWLARWRPREGNPPLLIALLYLALAGAILFTLLLVQPRFICL